MDAKDLRTEPALTERSSDGNVNYASSGPSFQCADKNKSYHDIGSNSLPKVDVQTTRPCAVIGPDRVVLPAADPYVKRGLVEPWQFTRPPEYPHKMPDYPHQLTRNISPRQTFQENMSRIMVPPTRYPVKVAEDPTLQTDKSSMMKNITKINIPSEPKYCDVPYTVNPMMNEHKSARNTELPVSNVDVLLRSAPHGWPSSGVNVRSSRGYAPSELYHHPDYSSCAVPRNIPVNRPHRTAHEEALAVYPDSYYRGGNIRFEPYPTATKDRYQLPRYEYMNNYSNPYNPPQYPPHKYDMQKLPTSTLSSHPYPGYPQVPLKYLEKTREPLRDGYQRSTNTQPNYGVPFHNQGMHPNYGPVPGNCLQNKLYTYPTDTPAALGDPHAKPPFETNKSYIPSKQYQTSNNYYLNELPGSHMKPQMMMPNYPAMNMHSVPPYPYPYRKESMPFKGYDFPPHYKNADPLFNTHLQRIPSQFSPNFISPVESNASNDHIFSVSPEDCGYVSQSSTTSIRSNDSAMNRFKMYDPRYGPMSRGSPLALRAETDAKTMNSKEKKNIDLRQFLQSWSEGDEEQGESNANKETRHQNSSDPKQYEVVNDQQQLYVLGLVNVPSEELDKYEHIQKVSKLPDNIKGYTSIDLLNQFEEAIESSKIDNNSYPTRIPESKEAKPAIKTNVHIPNNTPNRPLSPLDVEAKISQSVIHKDVGCNFEIRLCSPKMMNVEVAAPAQNVLGERVIEKVANPLIVRSPSVMSDIEENCRIVKRQNRRRSLSKDETPNVPSCKMIKTQYSAERPTENKKACYSIQDLESNSGVCLASLPRLDNDIELNFPEVNQQFINANKVEPTTIATNEIDEPGSVESKQRCERKDASSSPLAQSEDREFAKLSKYRKLKMNKESMDEIIKTPAHPIRTDSVIIKNPENSENISMAEEKRNSSEITLENNDKCNEQLKFATTSMPMNLAMNEYPSNLCDTTKVHSNSTVNEKSAIVAIDLVQVSDKRTKLEKVDPETVAAEVKYNNEPADFFSDKVDNFVKTKQLTEIDHNKSLNKNESGYNEPDNKLDDEVLSLEQERRRQSLSLEAQLTPMSEDTSSDDSDTESDDGSYIGGGEPKTILPCETKTLISTVKNSLDTSETKIHSKIFESKCRVQFENKYKNEHEIPECSILENTLSIDNSRTASADLSPQLIRSVDLKVVGSFCKKFSGSEIKENRIISIETAQNALKISEAEPISNVSASDSSFTEKADSHSDQPVINSNQSDDSDTDSLSECESSSSGSTSETEHRPNSMNHGGDLDCNNLVCSASVIESSSPNSEQTLSSSHVNKEKPTESGSEILDDVAPRLYPDPCPGAEKVIEEDASSKIDSIVSSCVVDNNPRLNDTEKSTVYSKDENQLLDDADLEATVHYNCERVIGNPIEKNYDFNLGRYCKRPLSFYKELFCATFQHLILEEGFCGNKTESKVTKSHSSIGYVKDKAQYIFESNGIYEKSPTDLVEEHLERIHASDQDSSDESDENHVIMDSYESDSTVKIDCNNSDAKNVSNLFNSKEINENDMIAAETEDLIYSLSEEPQHVLLKVDREINSKSDNLEKKENNNCKSPCEPEGISIVSILTNNTKNAPSDNDKSEFEHHNDNNNVMQCEDRVVLETCGTSQDGSSSSRLPAVRNNSSDQTCDSCKPESDPQQPNDIVTECEKIVTKRNNVRASEKFNVPPNHTVNVEEPFNCCQTDLKQHNNEGKVSLCEDPTVEGISVECQQEKKLFETTSNQNTDEPCDKSTNLESELHNDKNNVTHLGDVFSGASATFQPESINSPKTLINNLNPDNFQSGQPNENNIVTQFDGVFEDISDACLSEIMSIPKAPKHNTEEACESAHSQSKQNIHDDNVKQCTDDVFSDTSGLRQLEDMGILPNVMQNIKSNFQTETTIHNDSSVIPFEDVDDFETSSSSPVENIIGKPKLQNYSKEDSSDNSQSTQNNERVCKDDEVFKSCIAAEKCCIPPLTNNLQDAVCQPETDSIISCDDNRIRPIRRTIKRSLSESAVYSNSRDYNKHNVENEEFHWIKRKKITEPNVVNQTHSPLLTSENLTSFIQSRRNSISSFYHEENVSFCILIDNDCIIAQDEFDQEAICFADIPEENFSTVVDNHILTLNEEPRSTIPLDQDAVDDEVSNSMSHGVTVPLCPETMDEKTVEESWVEDVACVETVVTEDSVEEDNSIYEDADVASPNDDDETCDSSNSDLNIYSTNDHADKIKNIYGSEMCSSQSINIIRTLYTTPQMDVNKTLHDTESQIVENTVLSVSVKTVNTSIIYDESSYDSKSNETDTVSNGESNDSVKNDHEIQGNSSTGDIPVGEIGTKTDDINIATKSSEILNETGMVQQYETSNDEVFYPKETDGTPVYKRSSSSPEVSSTTEEKKAGILLKITNYNGSRISHINNVDVDSNRRIRCKFTEEYDYRSNMTSSRPLITKAAQKYIPPLKETTVNDLKVKLFLPEQSLIKLKQIKKSKEPPKIDVQKQINVKPNHKISKTETKKKPKPKFEDVLKSIDEIHIKMHKEKSKKVDKSVPKVIIKKNNNGSHYASSTRETFNPDMTGRKWQPWVFLEKHKFIDKMASRGKTRAVFCHRKNTYILAENFKKYRSMGSTKFTISQPKSDSNPSGPLKYTIKLKQLY